MKAIDGVEAVDCFAAFFGDNVELVSKDDTTVCFDRDVDAVEVLSAGISVEFVETFDLAVGTEISLIDSKDSSIATNLCSISVKLLLKFSSICSIVSYKKINKK